LISKGENMARAEKKMETVTRLVKVEKEEEVVQLTLSKEEAKALHMLLRKVVLVSRYITTQVY
jgi:hypothetical protein